MDWARAGRLILATVCAGDLTKSRLAAACAARGVGGERMWRGSRSGWGWWNAAGTILSFSEVRRKSQNSALL